MSKNAIKKRARREALAKPSTGANTTAGPQGGRATINRIRRNSGGHVLQPESHRDLLSPVKPSLEERLQSAPRESPLDMDLDSNDETLVDDSAATQRIRDILIPIITKNIETRRLSSQPLIRSKEAVYSKVSIALTDDRCHEFAQISNRLKAKLSGASLGTVSGSPEGDLSKFMDGIRNTVLQTERKTSFEASTRGSHPPVSLASSRSTPSLLYTPSATHERMEERELPIFTDPFNGSFDSVDMDYLAQPMSEKAMGKRKVTEDEVEEGQVLEENFHLSQPQPRASVPQPSREPPISSPPTQGPIPGVWFITPGAQHSDILRTDFFIEETTHQSIARWCTRHRPLTSAR
jgi:hypothetical protein